MTAIYASLAFLGVLFLPVISLFALIFWASIYVWHSIDNKKCPEALKCLVYLPLGLPIAIVIGVLAYPVFICLQIVTGFIQIPAILYYWCIKSRRARRIT